MRTFLVVVAVVSLVVSACGGDGAPEQSADPVSTTTTADIEAPDADAEPVPTEDSEPEDAPEAPEPRGAATTDATTRDPGPADEAFLASLDGVIVFSSERDDEGDDSSDDIYQMNSDGTDVRRLTDSDRNEWWPQVSADGSTLLFGRTYPGENRSPRSGHAAWGIWIREAGADPVDLTDNGEFQSGGRLSPDGSKILFTSARGNSAGFEDGLYELGATNVWVMSSDGSDARQLTDMASSAGSWSPDGSEIVFSGRPDGREDSDIFVMAADGSGVRQVTDAPSNDSRPDWSPNGSRIVFDSDRDGDAEIFVIGVDGSGLAQLTDNDTDDDFARWSPDGEAIVFTSDRDGNSEIYVMAADGASQTNISNDDALDILPSWSGMPFG